MDKIDIKLLLELDLNPRASFSQLGKAARINKETAQYRFKQLMKNEILTGFYSFINSSRLGLSTYKILIKYKSVTKEIQENIKKVLIENKIVSWAGTSEGAWDLVITVLSPNSRIFSEFYLRFFNDFGKYFNQKEILISINSRAFNDKYLSEGKLLYNNFLDFASEKANIDENDKKILLELSLNSRITFTEIGQNIGLNYSAVSQRYKKLIKDNIIVSLKPRIDFRKLGHSYYHLFVELNDESIRDDLIKYYTQHQNCIFIMNHLGHYSMHLELVSDESEIQEIIMDLREKFGDSIKGYESLKINKEYVMNMLR